MFSYLTGDNILFSNDAFGQHYATEYMFNDRVDQAELMMECIKYYANILTPFSPLVIKKINEVLSFNLPVDMICTSHGVIWRDQPDRIVHKYLEWANAYKENQITLLYDTMWNGTRIMAENIAAGIKLSDDTVNIKLFNTAKRDKNDIITEVFKSKGIVVGSPTINRGILSSMAGILEEIKGLNFAGKKAAAFGCYGWSGESVTILSDMLKASGFDIVDGGLKVLWNPDEKSIKQCMDYGASLSALLS
ncbi:MAG: flavodoxin domain-containing protein [Desulfobacterales bacterium]|nr:flavodoxin domain-containing protein [Desulfobacterales bacterium]MDD4071224.1 flavodoxin domain-containing protein [Desulfobacterales bacterium]MDD4393970.1 flavodoxin domain-containing protein [Desulfobacterales bacterium]